MKLINDEDGASPSQLSEAQFSSIQHLLLGLDTIFSVGLAIQASAEPLGWDAFALYLSTAVLGSWVCILIVLPYSQNFKFAFKWCLSGSALAILIGTGYHVLQCHYQDQRQQQLQNQLGNCVGNIGLCFPGLSASYQLILLHSGVFQASLQGQQMEYQEVGLELITKAT